MKRLLYATLPLLVSACAVLDPQDPPAAKPFVHKPPPKKTLPKRQFGALWSEDSVWNDMYSASAARAVGDIVVVKLSESMKTAIIERYDRLVPPVEEPEPVVVSDSEANAEENSKLKAAKAAAAKQKELTAPKVVRALIREVRPRGSYLISGSEIVTIGARKPRVTLEGLVRDRDMDAGDNVVSDQILELKYDVTTANAPRATAANENGATANGG